MIEAPKFQFSRKYALLALLLFAVEVIIATKLKNFSFIRYYFGDFLVVILLYCMAKMVYPFKAKPLAVGIFIFACCVEVSQYLQLPDLLGLSKMALHALSLARNLALKMC